MPDHTPIMYQRLSGSTKILYCAHPDDFEKYLDEVTFRLYRAYNQITICYTFEQEYLTPEIIKANNIELLAVPVTENFLADDCRVRTDIFLPVMEADIPVLPILMEPGLADRFNELCNDIQLLDLMSNDSSALSPFRRIWDNLMKNVGKTYDGTKLDSAIQEYIHTFKKHIFLSYRRIDRTHANKMIRMLHDFEFMRGVGIWYDEYLEIGRDYNDEIREKLLQADLVVILSTPHLTMQNNYVQSIEYPVAVANNKRIIVIEADPTDHNALKEALPGIKDILDPNEPEKIRNVLMEVFGDCNYTTTDPITLTNMGKAYLMGIGTEVNRQYAEELLTQAFGSGSIEAGNALLSFYMYRNMNDLYDDKDDSSIGQIEVISEPFDHMDYHKAAEIAGELVAYYSDIPDKTPEDYMNIYRYTNLLVQCRSCAGHHYTDDDVQDLNAASEALMEMHDKFPTRNDDNIISKCFKQLSIVMSGIPFYRPFVQPVIQKVWKVYSQYLQRVGFDPEWDMLRLASELAFATKNFSWMDTAKRIDDYYRDWLDQTRGDIDPAIYSPEYSKTKSAPIVEGREIEWDYLASSTLLYFESRKWFNENNWGEFDPPEKEIIDEEADFWEEWMYHLHDNLVSRSKPITAVYFRQTFYEAFGMYALMLEKYDIAGKFLKAAYDNMNIEMSNLDQIYTQLRNARNLIMLGENTGDENLVSKAKTALGDLKKIIEKITHEPCYD
ncbi:MAG: toll/interleukin-1 receptor domain-containing protein [Lachnospiraceae bacterium]|nr:toll/interleukin-1 receptor domain-containing protein [Lachnospiraceae bacterium]